MGAWGGGSIRERRPGVWELRVAAGVDPTTGRTVQRSYSFHGDHDGAEARCAELAAEHAARRVLVRAAPFLTVGALIDRWIAAHHDWTPSTWSSYRSNARALAADPIAARRVTTLTPEIARAAIARWHAGGAQPSVLSGRFRALRAALGWAYDQRIIDRHPLDGMRGPPQPLPRLHAPPGDVIRLLRHAERVVEKMQADDDGGASARRRLHRAEQTLLLVRLAADTGARRGELTALKIGDLEGRVLTISRAVSMEMLGPTKTRRVRRLTVGVATAALWHGLVVRWASRLAENEALSEWLFSRDLDHATRMTTSHAAHSFSRLRTEACVPGVTLHRLRHTVATFLVGRGDLLKAQHRLGHREASTTLRNYAHALPLEDEEAADAIDELLAASDDAGSAP